MIKWYWKIFKNKLSSWNDTIGGGKSLRYKGYFSINNIDIYIDTFIVLPKNLLPNIESIIKNRLDYQTREWKIEQLHDLINGDLEAKESLYSLVGITLNDFVREIWFEVNKIEMTTKCDKRNKLIDNITN